MAPPKRYWAKIKLPTEFLKTLPNFPTPISKSRLKKLAAEERRAQSEGTTPPSGDTSKISSPAPTIDVASTMETTPAAPEPVPKKEPASSNLHSSYVLDKSGGTVRKWIKQPRQFKTFSGFKVKYQAYAVLGEENIEKKEDVEPNNVKQETK